MRIANYRGVSLESRIIRFLTRSKYSHTAFVFDQAASAAAERCFHQHNQYRGKLDWIRPGAVVEAWVPTVRNVPSVGNSHTPGTKVDIFDFVTPLNPFEEEALVIGLVQQIGKAYDWKDVWRFVTRRPGNLSAEKWFCSELVFAACWDVGRKLLAETKPWEVPPGWIQRSPLLKFSESVITT